MPPAKRPTWERRPDRTSSMSDWTSSKADPQAERDMLPQSVNVEKITAKERKLLCARLLWLADYKPIFAAERAMSTPLLDLLKTN